MSESAVQGVSLRGRKLPFKSNVINLIVVIDACVRRATSVETVFAVGSRFVGNGVGRSRLQASSSLVESHPV